MQRQKHRALSLRCLCKGKSTGHWLCVFHSTKCLLLFGGRHLEHFVPTGTAGSFIHSVFCLTTGPKPPPKRFLHIVRSRASSFKWEYPLLSLRSSSSFLRLLPHLLATSISPFIFPSITCFRRQFLRKMWPIQLAFHFLISCRIFLCSLTLSNTSSFLTILRCAKSQKIAELNQMHVLCGQNVEFLNVKLGGAYNNH